MQQLQVAMSTVQAEKALNAPPDEVGQELLGLDEDQWFERKSGRIDPVDLAKALIGLANADGGLIVVGLHDGVVEGVDARPKSLNPLTQAGIDFCSPPVRARSRLIEGRDAAGRKRQILAIEVESSEVVHANQRDEVFLRIGDENRRLTFSQRQELLYDKGQASYETRPMEGADFQGLDDELLEHYRSAIEAPDGLRLLRARGLATEKELTVAGGLLFAEVPQAHLPEAFVRVLRYRGKERGTGSRQQLMEDIRIEGPLPRQLLAAQEAVDRLQPKRRALGSSGRFEDVALVPQDAWLEGIVNAVVHRSYSVMGDHIRVEIFDDRIEVSSPGRFPGLVDLSDPLETVRFARNPRIARVCADLNFGQELGEGIRRIFEEMQHAGLTEPVYRQTSGSVELKLLAEPVDRRLEAGLPGGARLIAAALRTAGHLSTGEVRDLLGVSRPIAQRELNALKDAGIVEWIGKSRKDPRAYWQLKTR
jgi:ATP-dependent DNA helicase RecG